ncbi:MAG: hypothetical protein KGJ88_13530 [Verrucomicrobiota bacterium]|nr:hypothetical protein [Verrucomicrobiota bacterium]
MAVVVAWRCILSTALLLPIAFGFFPPFVFINFIQDEFADGAFMRHLVEKLELVGIPLDPFVNLFIGARIFTVLHRRTGCGCRCWRGGSFCGGRFGFGI